MTSILSQKIAFLNISVILISVFLPSLITGNNLPDGLFWGKELLYLTISSIMIAVISTSFFFKKNARIKIHWIDILILIYFSYRSINSYYFFPLDGIPTSIYTNLSCIYCYIGIRLLIQSYELSSRCFSATVLVIFTIQVIYGLLQNFELLKSFHVFFPITGAFFNPAPYSLLLSMCMPFSIMYSIYLIRKKYWFFLFLLIVLQLLGVYLIYLCYSRGVWISLIFSILIFLSIRYGKGNWVKIRKFVATYLILMIPLSFYLYNLKPVSANGRILIWRISLDVIRENFIFGVGEGNFDYNFINQQNVFFKSLKNVKNYGTIISDIRFAFNDLLQILAEDGVVGFIIFFIILITVVKMLLYIIKYKAEMRNFTYSLLIMLCILIFGGLFSYPLSLLPFKVIIVVVFAFTVNSYLLAKGDQTALVFIKAKARFLFAFISMFLSATILWNVTRIYTSLKIWSNSIIYSYQQQVIVLENLKPKLSDNGYFLYFLGSSYLQNDNYKRAIDNLNQAKLLYPDKDVYLNLAKTFIKLDNLCAAEMEYKFLINSFPNDIELYSILARFYSEYRKYDSLNEVKVKVQSLIPGRDVEYFEQIKREIINLN